MMACHITICANSKYNWKLSLINGFFSILLSFSISITADNVKKIMTFNVVEGKYQMCKYVKSSKSLLRKMPDHKKCLIDTEGVFNVRAVQVKSQEITLYNIV